MKFVHGIVVVNRPDLLARAVESVRPLWPHAFILDNSPGGRVGRSKTWPLPVVRPSVPLSVAQTMNYLLRVACDAGAGAFGFQHNDAEAAPGSADAFLAFVAKLLSSRRRWAAVLTHYDTLSAYHVEACLDVGEWDTAFPQPNYHVDNDWMRRARLRGYELIDSGIEVRHHNGASSTIKSSPARRRVNEVTFPMNDAYYARKWGGPPGREVFPVPWDDLAPQPEPS